MLLVYVHKRSHIIFSLYNLNYAHATSICAISSEFLLKNWVDTVMANALRSTSLTKIALVAFLHPFLDCRNQPSFYNVLPQAEMQSHDGDSCILPPRT